MKVIVTNSYDETCAVIANMIKELVNAKPDAKLGLATGGTPVPIYKKLIEMNKAGEVDFSRVHTVNLDEYCGIPGTHDQSYRYFMDTNLFDHINIDKKNTFVASGMGDFEANARELEEKVREGGAADLQLLGIGNNGHIAFNEASDHLIAVAHTEKLTESTINANARFFEKKEDVPTMAITMGMGDILAAKKVVLAATGLAKVPAIRGLIMDDVITTQNPSTMLKMQDLRRTHVAMAEIRRKVWKCSHDVALGFFQLLHRTNGKGMTKVMNPRTVSTSFMRNSTMP